MDINDYNLNQRVKKARNYGYLFGALMLIVTAAVTVLLLYFCFGDLSKELSGIFAKDGFWKILKALFKFIGNLKKELGFTKGLTTLYYFDIFCLLSSVLGFVQGAFYKKRNNI